MRHVLNRALAFAIIAVCLGRAATAQRASLTADVAGTWQGRLTLDGLPHSVTLQLSLRDAAIVGTFSDNCWVVRDHVCVEDGSQQIDRVQIAGDTLRFVVEALEFRGVVEGGTMRLTMSNPYDKSTRSFIAIRRQPVSP